MSTDPSGPTDRRNLPICRFRPGGMAKVELFMDSEDVITSHIRRDGTNFFYNQTFWVQVWNQNGTRVYSRGFRKEETAQHIFNQFKLQIQPCGMGMRPTIGVDPAWT